MNDDVEEMDYILRYISTAQDLLNTGAKGAAYLAIKELQVASERLRELIEDKRKED